MFPPVTAVETDIPYVDLPIGALFAVCDTLREIPDLDPAWVWKGFVIMGY
jgi:hypothetical protein